jgi:hypothetical protein
VSGPAADPDVVADGHRLAGLDAGRPPGGVERVGRGVRVNARPELAAVADGDGRAVEGDEPVVGEEVVADGDAGAVVTADRRLHDGARARAAEQFAQESLPKVVVAVGRPVVPPGEGRRRLALGDESGVLRVVGSPARIRSRSVRSSSVTSRTSAAADT